MASATTQEEARRAFERALEIDPESVDARIGLGGVLVSGEDMEGGSNLLHQNITRAEQLLFEALKRDPTRPSCLGQIRSPEIGTPKIRPGTIKSAQIEPA